MIFLKKINRRITKILGIKELYKSETSKVRDRVILYCNGNGCDVGFGGDKIMKTNCIGIDLKSPYAYTGQDKVDIICDVMKEQIPILDNTYDYVYTSHLIEDFVDTKKALEEFIRILKTNGNLILVFPDQVHYEAHCIKTNQTINTHHVHKNMGLLFMHEQLNKINNIKFDILYESDCEIDYNVIIVAKVSK